MSKIEYEKSNYTDVLGQVFNEADLNPADVILSLAEGFVSHGIAAFTGGHWSHAQVVVKVVPEVTNILQAVGTGVEMPEYNNWKAHLTNPAVVMRMKYITDVALYNRLYLFNADALRMQGINYAYGEIGNIFLTKLLARDASAMDDGITPASIFCSHGASRLIRETIEYDIDLEHEDHLTTPNGIFRSSQMEIAGHILPNVWPREKEPDEMEDSLNEGSV